MPISVKALKEAFRDITNENAVQLNKMIKLTEGWAVPRDAEKTLEFADKAIGGFGVESIRGDGGAGGFWQEAVAAYVNTGDTYSSTVLYDTNKKRFYLTTFGDFVEKNDKKLGIY